MVHVIDKTDAPLTVEGRSSRKPFDGELTMPEIPDPSAAVTSRGPGLVTIKDVVCLRCGCLCDDLEVEVDSENSRIARVSNACEIGARWFGRLESEPTHSLAAQESAEAKVSLARAARILADARFPVIFGLTQSLTETTLAAVGLAERIGARIVLDRNPSERGRLTAFQNQGRVSATLGEVKNRSDFLLYWRCDPVSTHPRHLERYSAEAPGRFLPGGRSSRTVVVVDASPNETAKRADHFVELPPEADLEAMLLLRLFVAGLAPGATSLCPSVVEDLRSLASTMKAARHGAIFHGSPGFKAIRPVVFWEAVTRLTRDLNESARFVQLSLGAPGNRAGAEAALAWLSGFAQDVDYREGGPKAADDLAGIDALLASGEPDAVLMVGTGPPVELSEAARAHLAGIPWITIGPDAIDGVGQVAAVSFTSARPGLDEAGSVTRVDGVALPVRALTRPRFLSEAEWIRRITEQLTTREAATVP